MITQDRLLSLLCAANFSDVKAAFVVRAKIESSWSSTMLHDLGLVELAKNELETVISTDGQKWIDGRPVIDVKGRLWAVSATVHAQRIAAAIADAQKVTVNHVNEEQLVIHGQCVAIIDGQLCGGDLTLTPICPRCTLGKMGVQSVLECDVCGHRSAIMRQA